MAIKQIITFERNWEEELNNWLRKNDNRVIVDQISYISDRMGNITKVIVEYREGQTL